jgi:hypothetical protein
MPASTCDLHNHTLYSDGALTPTELVDLAAARGVAALALTDHDTVAGLPEAERRGALRGVEIVAGIELSVEEGSFDVHLLGYFIRRPEQLAAALEEIQTERRSRARRMVERLAELGCRLDLEAVLGRARGGVVGRPHVAEELVHRGYVRDMDEAFDRYLASGRPAYSPKRSLGLEEAAGLLRRSGAVPVVAHPGPSDLDPLLPRLGACGVLGLEVWHPRHDAGAVRRYRRAAEEGGLLPTGGSDFHRLVPGGIQPGDLQLPIAVLDALRPHAT